MSNTANNQNTTTEPKDSAPLITLMLEHLPQATTEADFSKALSDLALKYKEVKLLSASDFSKIVSSQIDAIVSRKSNQQEEEKSSPQAYG